MGGRTAKENEQMDEVKDVIVLLEFGMGRAAATANSSAQLPKGIVLTVRAPRIELAREKWVRSNGKDTLANSTVVARHSSERIGW